jgi:hypothetical protein
MIKRPTSVAVAPVEFPPDREELRSMIVILGEDAESIAFRNVESDRRTVEWQNTLQSRANGKQQLTLTQFSNDRVVDLKENPKASLRRLCRTRIAGNGGHSPGLLLFSIFRCHYINTNFVENGILHACVTANPEVATQFEATTSIWTFRRLNAIQRRSWEHVSILNYFLHPAFRETFRPFGYHTVDALAGSGIRYCFHTSGEVAATRRFFKV